MLIKEFRICMPMPVEEYRIGQLYMIMKKSREESEGVDSGVEIIKNEPYACGPGGNGGQYTFKIYHVGKHLPSWLRSLFPKSALCVYEEAWNAYPYTLTRFRTPFMEKFQLDIESRYLNDAGVSENVFNLSPEELRQRDVVHIDIVRDHVSDYHPNEDPKLYRSTKTGRGPLGDNWRQEHEEEQNFDSSRSESGLAPKTFDRRRIMCAYKLCRVEFRYWGMQTRVENFISEYALRKTLIRAHRQAWCWQDEFIDLSIDDIRRMEGEVQKMLAAKMKRSSEASRESLSYSSPVVLNSESESNANIEIAVAENDAVATISDDPASAQAVVASLKSSLVTKSRDDLTKSPAPSRDWSLEEEFFDAEEDLAMFMPSHDSSPALSVTPQPGVVGASGSPTERGPIVFIVLLCETTNEDGATGTFFSHSSSVDSAFASFISTLHATASCFAIDSVVSKRCMFKMFHCPNVASEVANALSHLTPSTRKTTSFHTKTSTIASPSHSSVLAASSLLLVSSDLGAKTLKNAVNALTDFTNEAVAECRAAFPELANSKKPTDVCFLADGHSSIVLYEALTRWPAVFDPESGEIVPGRTWSGSNTHRDFSIQSFHQEQPLLKIAVEIPAENDSNSRGPSVQRALPSFCNVPMIDSDLGTIHNNNDGSYTSAFVAKRCFLVGSPLGLILAHRMYCCVSEIFQPSCLQVYNVFYETDPLASRIEPLLINQLGEIAPAELPRLVSWNWCDQNYSIKTAISSMLPNRDSATMLSIDQEGLNDGDQGPDINGFWGTQRIDYSLNGSHAEISARVGMYREMPSSALIQLLQASYWENRDLAAFILQQLFGGNNNSTFDRLSPMTSVYRSESIKERSDISPKRGIYEKWLKPHRLFKLRRPVPNHHASDVVFLNSATSVTIRGHMAYGAMDMIDLNGEKVDCHVETSSELFQDRVWHYVGTNLTNENGDVSFIASNVNNMEGTAVELLSPGFHRVLMVVRGDHTMASLTLAVLPPGSRVALFSIDGSFSASLSLSGANPRLHAGCVEVVRHWAQAGYIIFYISSRPDSQQNQVVGWLAKHNFPLGLMAFPSSGITAEAFRAKSAFIHQLVSDTKLDICSAYGSPKDIAIYADAGVEPHRMFIVGRAKRVANRQQDISINWLSDGYAEHLRWLIASGFASFAPVQQWSLLRQWWSCVTPDFLLTLTLPNSQVDNNSGGNNNGNLLAAPSAPPPLPPPRLTATSSQHRFVSITKDPNNGHTTIKNIIPVPNEVNN